jgi:hypothetical protein
LGRIVDELAEVAEGLGIFAIGEEQEMRASRNAWVTSGMAASPARYSGSAYR